MPWLTTIRSELLGLFIDDAWFAAAIVAWIAVCWLLLPRLGLPAAAEPGLLFAGLVAILIESARRAACRAR